ATAPPSSPCARPLWRAVPIPPPSNAAVSIPPPQSLRRALPQSPAAPTRNAPPPSALASGSTTLCGTFPRPDTNPAASPYSPHPLLRRAAPPARPPVAVVPPHCPWEYDIPPATVLPAATASVGRGASNTPANCSSDTCARRPARQSTWPAPDSDAHSHTPSSNTRCHCRPPPAPCNGR